LFCSETGGKGKKTYNPNRSSQQTQLNITQRRVNSLNNQIRVQLHPNPNTNNTKIHHQQRIKPPVKKNTHQIPQRPRRRVIHPFQIMVMHQRIRALQRWPRARHPAHGPATSWRRLARCDRAVGEPPEQGEAQRYGDDAVDEEHPLEADEALGAVHFLEAGGDEADYCGGDLRGCEVLAYAFADARGWVEES
jgi:hypothetical protein